MKYYSCMYLDCLLGQLESQESQLSGYVGEGVELATEFLRPWLVQCSNLAANSAAFGIMR